MLQACHFFIFVSSEVLVRMGLFLEKNDRNSELFPFHQKTPLGQMMPEPLYRIYVRVATLCSVYDNYHTIIGIGITILPVHAMIKKGNNLREN